MKATTIRFADDVWTLIEREAGASGVSVAQFIRDAALARVVYAAATRGEPVWGHGGDGALSSMTPSARRSANSSPTTAASRAARA